MSLPTTTTALVLHVVNASTVSELDDNFTRLGLRELICDTSDPIIVVSLLRCSSEFLLSFPPFRSLILSNACFFTFRIHAAVEVHSYSLSSTISICRKRCCTTACEMTSRQFCVAAASSTLYWSSIKGGVIDVTSSLSRWSNDFGNFSQFPRCLLTWSCRTRSSSNQGGWKEGGARRWLDTGTVREVSTVVEDAGCRRRGAGRVRGSRRLGCITFVARGAEKAEGGSRRTRGSRLFCRVAC